MSKLYIPGVKGVFVTQNPRVKDNYVIKLEKDGVAETVAVVFHSFYAKELRDYFRRLYGVDAVHPQDVLESEEEKFRLARELVASRNVTSKNKIVKQSQLFDSPQHASNAEWAMSLLKELK